MQFRNLPSGAVVRACEDLCAQKNAPVDLGAGVEIAHGRIHEALGAARDHFALAIAAKLTGAVAWIGDRDDVQSLAATGLQDFIDPSRLILITAMTRLEALWTAEKALRSGGADVVVAELQNGPDLTESQRLQIAAHESGAIGLILISGRAQASACQTRWLCTPHTDDEFLWEWRRQKDRMGTTGAWRAGRLGEQNGAHIVHLAADPAA